VTLANHDEDESGRRLPAPAQGLRPQALRRLLRGAGLEVETCDVTSREHRPPRLRVVSAFARKTAS